MCDGRHTLFCVDANSVSSAFTFFQLEFSKTWPKNYNLIIYSTFIRMYTKCRMEIGAVLTKTNSKLNSEKAEFVT